MVGIRQHFRDFQLSCFGQPSMKNFQEEITLEIDEDWFGVLVAAFSAASP